MWQKAKMNWVKLLVCLLLIMPFQSSADNPKLTIACAANFSATMNKLVDLFYQQAEKSIEIRVAVGSSGALASQIRHGAPFDLFFSADEYFPNWLDQADASYETMVYARGELVLYSREKKHAPLPQWLNEIDGKTLAIANPKLAPYGRAAIQVLQGQNLTPLRTVQGTSVLQAFQYVESGHANYGLIAKSLLQADYQGSYVTLPVDWYEPIEQHAMLLTTNAIARSFLQFVKSDEAQQLIKTSGYR